MQQRYLGGRIFTADPERPWADALLVRDGHLAAVGSIEECHAATDPAAPVDDIDVTGCLVLPGFVDAHAHLLMTGDALGKAQLRTATTLEEIRRRLVEWAEAHPGSPSVLGTSFLFEAIPGNAPTRQMLDDLFPDRPVFIDSFDLHCGWVNSAALAAMEITDDTPDPIGGEIRRDPVTGHATGYLLETALHRHMWAFLARTDDATRDGHLATAQHALAAAGTTTAVDMGVDADDADAFERAETAGTLTVRVIGHWVIRNTGDDEQNLAQVREAARRREHHGGPMFRIAGIKLVTDGTIDACTAAMIEPYTTGTNCHPIWPLERMLPVVELADRLGLQVACHAIGDQAVRNAIDAIVHAQQANGTGDRRHRIEHLEYADPADIPRLGANGITASMQPVHCDPAIAGLWSDLLGPQRAQWGFAWPEYLRTGATLAFGTDTPTAPYQPLPNMYIGATRRSPEQPDLEPLRPDFALALDDALVHGTRDAAWASFEEERLGILRAGACADLVVIDDDPFVGGPQALLSARVRRTVVAGRTVHVAG
jgi:predicted amidohydrolase YtcJ